jgi:hypothetical protein
MGCGDYTSTIFADLSTAAYVSAKFVDCCRKSIWLSRINEKSRFTVLDDFRETSDSRRNNGCCRRLRLKHDPG